MDKQKCVESLTHLGGVEQIAAMLQSNVNQAVSAVSNFKQSKQFEKLSSQSSDIRMEIGDQIPADGLFVYGHSLKVDESSMTAVTIVVVAISEGLPLAVTLTLTFSMKRMMKDNAKGFGNSLFVRQWAQPQQYALVKQTETTSISSSDLVTQPNLCSNHGGTCAICLDTIKLQETAIIKGCDHAYCVTCILRWATYCQNPTCPQCKHPLEFLDVHRCLDGSIQDCMFEESVCLLLRASWFKPLVVEEYEEDDFGFEDYYAYEDEEDDLDDVYFSSVPTLRIGNRRWGDTGYVRAGRQEASPRVVSRPNSQGGPGTGAPRASKKKENDACATNFGGAGSSRDPKKKETVAAIGRRAKRALKREAEDKAAATKHQEHLVRFGLARKEE
ncbi:hypothetical protein ACFE04_027979 [Oxalis oulophora]